MDLAKLNSATKYPSILTYHEMGERGRLTPTVQVPFAEGSEIFVTEKVDGTNGRIVLVPESAPIVHWGVTRRWLIGSREEFLTAQGDLVYARQDGVVDALRRAADFLPAHPDLIDVFFFEVFGGNLPASKQYTASKEVSVRLFDQASVPLNILEMPIEKIASWREHDGQVFKSTQALIELCSRLAGMGLPLAAVPPLGTVTSLPTSLEATYEWLKPYAQSQCGLGGGKGMAEGVVVRTADRKTIAKIRFEDYERTLGVQRKR